MSGYLTSPERDQHGRAANALIETAFVQARTAGIDFVTFSSALLSRAVGALLAADMSPEEIGCAAETMGNVLLTVDDTEPPK